MKIAVKVLDGTLDNAFRQALYSRTPKSVLDLENVPDMEKYYIGYGHDSIGDNANLTVYVEDVPIVVAKALQDNPLYNGIETSTRYIDFSFNDDPEINLMINNYKHALDTIQRALPKSKDNTLIALDIARGLLPVMAKTKLSMTMSFRAMRYHLHDLLLHPFDVVCETATAILEELTNAGYGKYFTQPSQLESKEWYATKFFSDISPLWYKNETYGSSVFTGVLDYGSYRDLQRHRRMYNKSSIPIYTKERGLNSFYVDNYKRFGINLDLDLYTQSELKYSTLMINVDVIMELKVAQLFYLTKLRTSSKVHPTLRDFMLNLVNSLDDALPFKARLLETIPTDYRSRHNDDIFLNGKSISGNDHNGN